MTQKIIATPKDRQRHIDACKERDADSKWRGIVWTALAALGNKASLDDLYDQVKEHARVRKAESSGTDWKAIVRRVLQETCQPVERGVWALPQYVN